MRISCATISPDLIAMRKYLIVMVKEPRPGRVKTRLGRDIGMVAAAWWFRHQVARLLRAVEDPRWHVVIAVSPDRAGLLSRVWPTHLTRVAQGPGNLGDRMGRLLRGMPPGPVCVIGADVPGVTRTHIAKAFASLGAKDAVFGPALDGGYWLVGFKRTRGIPATLFHGVRWSSSHALEDTITTLRGERIGLIDALRDVDTVSDLRPSIP